MRLNLSTNSLQRNSSFVKKTGNGNIIEPKVTTTLHSNKTVGHNIHVTSPTTVSKAHPQVKASLQSGKIETKSARAKVHVQKSQKKPSAKSPVQSKGTQNKPAKLPQTTKQEKRYNPENDISLASLRRSTLTIYSTNKTYVRGECYSHKPPKAVPSVCTALYLGLNHSFYPKEYYFQDGDYNNDWCIYYSAVSIICSHYWRKLKTRSFQCPSYRKIRELFLLCLQWIKMCHGFVPNGEFEVYLPLLPTNTVCLFFAIF